MARWWLFFEVAVVSTKTWFVQKSCPLLLALFVFYFSTGQSFWPSTHRCTPSLPVWITKSPQNVLVGSSADFSPWVPNRSRLRRHGSTPDRVKTKPC